MTVRSESTGKPNKTEKKGFFSFLGRKRQAGISRIFGGDVGQAWGNNHWV